MTEADKYNLRVEILNLTLQREWEEFYYVVVQVFSVSYLSPLLTGAYHGMIGCMARRSICGGPS